MQHSFWFEKWRKAEIGFHQLKPHSALKKHFPTLNPGSAVLVPLCGKSKDMLWLQDQGYIVIGIELVEQAVLDFFKENNLEFTSKEDGAFTHFYADNLHLISGDFFALDPAKLPRFDALYDRAALVALPQTMRQGYADKCKTMLKSNASIFLISFSYDTSVMQGPPFSISESEIEQYWNGDLKLIESFDLLSAEPKFKEKGLSYMYEQTWMGLCS